VAFADNGQPITDCGDQPVSSAGTATCTVSYAGPETDQITAAYSPAGSTGQPSLELLQTVIQDSTAVQVSSQLVTTPPAPLLDSHLSVRHGLSERAWVRNSDRDRPVRCRRR
jgi:hypothetical protein